MADEDSRLTDSSVSGDAGHSDPLRVAAEAGAKLSTPAKMKMVRSRPRTATTILLARNRISTRLILSY